MAVDHISKNDMKFYLVRDLHEKELFQNAWKLYFVVKGRLEIKIYDKIFMAERDDVVLV